MTQPQEDGSKNMTATLKDADMPCYGTPPHCVLRPGNPSNLSSGSPVTLSCALLVVSLVLSAVSLVLERTLLATCRKDHSTQMLFAPLQA